jgi:hypothetical protein
VGLGAGRDPSGVLSFDEEESSGGVGIDADKLIELLEFHLHQAGVEDGSVEYSDGRLLLRLPPAWLAWVETFLEELRRDRGGLIDLEVRLLRMSPALFERLRADSAALTPAAEETLRAALAVASARLLSSHKVVAHDGQRVHVRRGGSRAYMGDLEVNLTGVVPVLNPVVTVLNEGLVVELRPTLDRQRGLVLLDVALSLSELDDPIATSKVADLAVELPRMRIARTAVTCVVPVGRGALLGGAFATEPGDDSLTCVVYVRPRLICAGRQERR